MTTMPMALATALLVSLGASLAACGSTPIPPTYTQEEQRLICERQRGWWHRDDLMGGYCEYRTARLAPGQPSEEVITHTP
jgi:hypothetical protein